MYLYNNPQSEFTPKTYKTKSKNTSRAKHALNRKVKTLRTKSGKGHPRNLTKKSREYLKRLGLKPKASKKKK